MSNNNDNKTEVIFESKTTGGTVDMKLSPDGVNIAIQDGHKVYDKETGAKLTECKGKSNTTNNENNGSNIW